MPAVGASPTTRVIEFPEPAKRHTDVTVADDPANGSPTIGLVIGHDPVILLVTDVDK